MSETYQDRVNKRTREEAEAFERDPTAKHQRHLDWWWQQKLAHKAAIRAARLSGEQPWNGEYDPVRRFTKEMDDQQGEADRRYF